MWFGQGQGVSSPPVLLKLLKIAHKLMTTSTITPLVQLNL